MHGGRYTGDGLKSTVNLLRNGAKWRRKWRRGLVAVDGYSQTESRHITATPVLDEL